MRRILVAIDGSQCSFRAVDYCGRQFSGLSDVSVTLFHVLPHLPPSFWDDGHILSDQERRARQEVVDRWLENRVTATEPLFVTAGELLQKQGIPPGKIERKIVSDSTDVAGSILEEGREGAYMTLVLGRCGTGRMGEFLLGSTTSRIISRGAGLAVCIVE